MMNDTTREQPPEQTLEWIREKSRDLRNNLEVLNACHSLISKISDPSNVIQVRAMLIEARVCAESWGHQSPRGFDLCAVAFKAAQKVLGPNDPDLYDAYMACGSLLAKNTNLKKKYAKLGASALAKGLKLQREFTGAMHPSLITTLTNLADLYNQAGEGQKALESGQEALSISEAVYAKDSLETAKQKVFMARLYSELGDQGQKQEAEALIRQALKLAVSLPSSADNDWLVKSWRWDLRTVLEKNGNLEGAAEQITDPEERQRYIANFLWTAATQLYYAKKISEFIEAAKKCIELPGVRPEAYTMLAAELAKAGETDNAKKVLRLAIEKAGEPAAYVQLGELLARESKGDQELRSEAIRMWQTAWSIVQENRNRYFNTWDSLPDRIEKLSALAIDQPYRSKAHE